MTQPSVNMTFDTSLIDTRNPNTSFSTTESGPSEAGATLSSRKAPVAQQPPSVSSEPTDNPTHKSSQPTPTPPPKTSTPVLHVPTEDAYDQWASVYDTDGNMLQAIDDVELETLLPPFLEMVIASNPNGPLNLLDLGCGTGRNTVKLLAYALSQTNATAVTVTGLDFSSGMLAIARQKLSPAVDTQRNTAVKLRLERADCFPTVSNPTASPVPEVPDLPSANGLISTLVLEHVPLAAYFATLSSLVAPGGYALVTNMHSEMGRVSQAGFFNQDGVKVRGKSFAHSPEETVEAAKRAAFEVVKLGERSVEREDLESGRVGERGWKWVGVRVWYGVVLRKV